MGKNNEDKVKVFTAPVIMLAVLTLLTGLYDKGLNSGIPLYYDGLGYSAAMGGMLVAVYTLSCTVARLLGGMATDRFAHMRVLMTSMVLLLAGVALPAIWDVFAIVIISRVLQGCGFALASNVISVLVQSLVPKGHIGQGAGLEGAGASLGMMFGATIATLSLDNLGFHGFFLMYVAIIIVCIIGCICIPRTKAYKAVQAADQANAVDTGANNDTDSNEGTEPGNTAAESNAAGKKRGGLRSLIIVPILPYVGVSFVHRLIRGLCISFVLIYSNAAHVGVGPIWFVVSGLAMLVCRFFGGKFYNTAGPWWLFPIVTINIIGFLLLLIWPNAITFYASALFCGISIGSSSAFLRTLTAKAAPKEHWGLAVGELLFLGDMGLAAGAYFGGVLLDVFGKLAFPAIAVGIDALAAVATFAVLFIGLKKKNQ